MVYLTVFAFNVFYSPSKKGVLSVKESAEILPSAYILFTSTITGELYNVGPVTVPFTPLPDWSYQVAVLMPGWSRERISPSAIRLDECAQCVGVAAVAMNETPAALLDL